MSGNAYALLATLDKDNNIIKSYEYATDRMPIALTRKNNEIYKKNI